MNNLTRHPTHALSSSWGEAPETLRTRLACPAGPVNALRSQAIRGEGPGRSASRLGSHWEASKQLPPRHYRKSGNPSLMLGSKQSEKIDNGPSNSTVHLPIMHAPKAAQSPCRRCHRHGSRRAVDPGPDADPTRASSSRDLG